VIADDEIVHVGHLGQFAVPQVEHLADECPYAFAGIEKWRLCLSAISRRCSRTIIFRSILGDTFLTK